MILKHSCKIFDIIPIERWTLGSLPLKRGRLVTDLNILYVFFKAFFFLCGPFLSLYWICYNIASILCFLIFGLEAYGILVPWPGIKTAVPALEGKVFLKKNYLFVFIFGCARSSFPCRLFSRCSEWGLLSSCGVQASLWDGFYCCPAWTVGHWGSVIAAHRL